MLYVPPAARILVVDDERCYRVYLASCLRSRGYVIHMSECAAEALAAFEREDGFDLVVTDLQMPGMNGLELRDELLRRRPATRVLVMTGGGSNRPGVVCKPATYQGLFALVEQALASPLRASSAGARSGPLASDQSRR